MFVVSECLLEKLGEKRRDMVLARDKKLQEAAPLILQAGEVKRESGVAPSPRARTLH